MTRLLLTSVLLLMAGCTDSSDRIRDGYVDVPNGRLYYEEKGAGTPVVMIHGGFLDSRMWDGQFATVAERYRAIRYDVRAHGKSTSDSAEFADHEDLRVLLDSLGVNQAVIVGLSLGGVIATDFALTYPERVSALALVGPGMSGFDFDSEATAAYVDDLRAAFAAEDFEQVNEVFARAWCDGPHRQPEDVDPLVREKVLEMLAGSELRWRYSGLAQTLTPPAVGRLTEIDVPTLAVVGDMDMPDILEIVDFIVEQVPGARRVVIPDVAHMVNMEKPQEFNKHLTEFLAGLN